MKNRGFTLIELMIVVSMIGILAAIAIPAYSGYITSAKLVEPSMLVQQLKPGLLDYYKTRGRFPKNNREAGIPEPRYLLGNYVKSITVENGAMHVMLGNKIGPDMDGKIISYRPLVVIGSPASPVSWTCGYAEPPDGMKAIGENRTDLQTLGIPSVCR